MMEEAKQNGKAPAPVEELRFVEDPAQIDRWWSEYVRTGVEEVIEESGGVCDFMPEEVYVCLKRKAAFLYLVIVDGKVGAFTIFQKGVTDWSRESYLRIWIGWSAKQVYTEAFFRGLPQLMRDLKYKKCLYMTYRKGFERKPPPGFKTVARLQAMEIE